MLYIITEMNNGENSIPKEEKIMISFIKKLFGGKQVSQEERFAHHVDEMVKRYHEWYPKVPEAVLREYFNLKRVDMKAAIRLENEETEEYFQFSTKINSGEQYDLIHKIWHDVLKATIRFIFIKESSKICPRIDYTNTDESVLVVPSSYMEFIGNNEETLLGCLAHELGHIHYGHNNPELYPSLNVDMRRVAEMEADRFAVNYLEYLGYSKECLIKQIKLWLENSDEPGLFYKAHLTNRNRLAFIKGETMPEQEQFEKWLTESSK